MYDLNKFLPKFWEQEDLNTTEPILTPNDEYCETLYKNTTKREVTGRYIVNLPILQNKINSLGDSLSLAKRCFISLERRFKSDPSLFLQYKDFISEYISLGHAEYLSSFESTNMELPTYYLPHHAILRPQSASTKLRVVFNASASTTTGASLNDVLLEGPNIYPEIIDIIMRFRLYKYVFSTDIVKMFRNILINKNHQQLQRMLWRDSPEENLKCIQLKTVTYGTKCAPYLAYKTLQTLSQDESESFPLAVDSIKYHTYMDDILHGANETSTLKQLIYQLCELLKCGGFMLHKWSSNCPELFDKIENNERCFNFLKGEHISTLGLNWNPSEDSFCISVEVKTYQNFTKRNTLSIISKTFDPMGFLSPVTVKAKIFIQELWKVNLDWDEPLSEELISYWNSFYGDWSQFNDF